MGRGVRPPRRVPGCLAHLLSEGEGLARRRRGPSRARGVGRGNRAAPDEQTERTLPRKDSISKMHLRREKEAAHAPATLRVAHAAKACDGPDLCVDAVGRLERGPRGLAHHVRPPRRIPTTVNSHLSGLTLLKVILFGSHVSGRLTLKWSHTFKESNGKCLVTF